MGGRQRPSLEETISNTSSSCNTCLWLLITAALPIKTIEIQRLILTRNIRNTCKIVLESTSPGPQSVEPSATRTMAFLRRLNGGGTLDILSRYGAGNPRDCVRGKVHSLVNRWTGWTAGSPVHLHYGSGTAGDPGHFEETRGRKPARNRQWLGSKVCWPHLTAWPSWLT